MKIINHITQGFNDLLFWLEEHYIGILTTIALHLFIISIILVLKIRTNAEREYNIVIDLSQIHVTEEQPEQPPTPQEGGAQQYAENQTPEYSIRNIPVNVANERAVENIEKMVRDIKTEMNITDPPPQQEQAEIIEQEKELLENEARIYEDKFPANAAGERTVYKGPTTVSYELSGRRHMWMPAPVYKCQGQGKIVVDIVVNPRGYVISAEINKNKSESQDLCLIEAAKRDAERSRFNDSSSAPAKQQGSITYIFIAQ